MKNRKSILVTSMTLLTFFVLAINAYKIPKGWLQRGQTPGKFDMGLAKGEGLKGSNAGTIRGHLDAGKLDNATLMQNIAPGKFAGHKIKLTGYVKTSDSVFYAILWMRIDKPGQNSHLDNMADRSLSGKNDWTKCEIVCDVPKNALKISFGGMMGGIGQMWFCNLKLEAVADSVKETGLQKEDIEGPPADSTIIINPVPTNLDFKD